MTDAPASAGRTRRAEWIGATLLVTAVFVVANLPLIVGRAVGIWDADGQFFPYLTLVGDHARALRLVSWDPWTNGGLPKGGDPQLGAYSPIVLAVAALGGGSSAGFIAYWLLLWWLGGIGVLLLARHLGASAWGAAVAALAFLFCGIYTGNAEHTPIVTVFSFLPWILWRLDVALTESRMRPAVEAGALWGLSALAGHPAIVMIVAMIGVAWTVGRMLTTTERPHDEYRGWRASPAVAMSCLALFAIVGVVVLAPTYVSFLIDGAGVHGRVGALGRDVALGNQFDPAAIVSLASAYVGRLKAFDRSLFPSSDVSMVSIHVGVIAPVLAVAALLAQPRLVWRWWIAGLAALCLAAAMGESLPVRGWLYDWIPPTRYFRHSAVFRLGFVFSVVVLAIEGARDLALAVREVSGRALRPFLVAAILTAAIALAGYASFLRAVWESGINHQAAIAAGAPWLGIVAAVVIGRLLPPRQRRRLVPAFLVALAVADALFSSVLAAPTVMARGAAVERWRALDAAHVRTLDLARTGWRRDATACPGWAAGERCKWNDQYLTKVPVLDAYATERNALHEAIASDAALRATATGSDRTWFAREIAEVSLTTANVELLAARAAVEGAPPIVSHSRGSMRRGITAVAEPTDRARIAALPRAERIAATLQRYEPRELTFDVDAPADGWLLITERWAPGWRASVDGIDVRVLGGNFVFRLVPVRAGRHTVELRYHQAASWLIVPSWLMLAVAALGALVRRSPRGSS